MFLSFTSKCNTFCLMCVHVYAYSLPHMSDCALHFTSSSSLPSALFVSLQLSPGVMNTLMKGTFNVTLNNPLVPCFSPRVAPGPLKAHKTINTVAPNTFIAKRTS